MGYRSPALRKRNVIWPVRRADKGWGTDVLVRRVWSALQHAIRTKQGTYPWAPEYGSLIDHYRTQTVSEADQDYILMHIRQIASIWVPDCVIVQTKLTANPDDENLTIQIVWGIPGAAAAGVRGSVGNRFAFGPYANVLTA